MRNSSWCYALCLTTLLVTISTIMFISLSSVSKVSYRRDMYIRAYITNDDEKSFIEKLGQNQRHIVTFYVNFLNSSEIIVKASESEYVENQLRSVGINYTILIRDQQALIDQVEEEIKEKRLKYSDGFDPENYHSLEEIEHYLQELHKNCDLVEVINLGKSYEGRNIQMATISTKQTNFKSIIFIDCTIHAKEWISTAVCLWILNELTTKYGKDADTTFLLDSFDWHIKPVSNPDGYAYTWTTDRLWRKTRAPTRDPSCIGVDANRNFQVLSNQGQDSLKNPCSPSYSGSFSFSESESRAIRNALQRSRNRVKAALFLHSYSQLWLSPFGFNASRAPHYEEMERVMKKAVSAMKDTNLSGLDYIYGPFSSVLYDRPGTSADYAYVEEHIIHSYTIELPDRGIYGFVMPVSKIEPIAKETWQGLKALAFAIMETI